MDGFDGIDIDAGLLDTSASDAIGAFSFNNTADFNAVMSLFNDLDSGALSFDDFSNDPFWDTNNSFDGFNDFLNDFFGWDGDNEPEPNPNEEEPIDEVIVTGTIVPQWQPSFFFDFDAYFDNIFAGEWWYPGADGGGVTSAHECGQVATPGGGTADTNGLNSLQQGVLSALIAIANANPDVTIDIPTGTTGQTTAVPIVDILSGLDGVEFVSTSLLVFPNGSYVSGDYHPAQGSDGGPIIRLSDIHTTSDPMEIARVILHESIHRYADTQSNIQDTQGNHDAPWMAGIGNAARDALNQAFGGGLAAFAEGIASSSCNS